MQTTMLNSAEHKLPEGGAINPVGKPTPALATRFMLGDWQVCPELNRLQHQHQPLQRQLEPRLMHLLCYLAANPERVLSRDELVEELWPRVIVNENSLTRAMSELRKHLTISKSPVGAYIETIPKKGYRLLPAVESVAPFSVQRVAAVSRRTQLPILQRVQTWLPDWQLSLRHGAIALCLSLVAGMWIGLQSSGWLTDGTVDSQLWADEVMEGQPNYFGGELTLSAADSQEALGNGLRSAAAPVISNDASEYAYIKYDNSGSTIFIGSLDALAAPVVAVYNSPEKLFNLTWSPLGHGLIFARQAKITNAALFAEDRYTAELMMLDLSTLQLHRLLPDTDPATTKPGRRQNLT